MHRLPLLAMWIYLALALRLYPLPALVVQYNRPVVAAE